MANEGKGAVERTARIQGVPNKKDADDYEQSKAGNEHAKANQNTTSSWLDSIPRHDYVNKYLPLQIAAMKGDWTVASKMLTCEPVILKRSITWTGETGLHLAAASGHTSFVKNWLGHNEIGVDDVAHPNDNKVTALAFAAATGTKMVAYEILSHKKSKHCKPVRFDALYMATLQGHTAAAHYLYLESDFQSWSPQTQITIINSCINSGMCDLALLMFQQCHQLALEKDENGERPLDVLARKPSAFANASERPFWRRATKCLFPWMKETKNETKGHILFKLMWKYVLENEISVSKIIIYGSNLLFNAAYVGNFEFLVELLNSCPELIYKVNQDMDTIFHIAICNRDKDTFNLIHEIGAFKDLITSYREETGKRNNILHKAALLPTKNRLKPKWGAALQMQHELLWFKAVETVVSPLFKDMTNADGLTPHELFLEEHEELMKKGEQEIRDIAKSCGIVAIVVFMAIFIVLGDSIAITGTPNLINRKFFKILLVSEAIAMVLSSASVLLFLSILVSSYAEEDVFKSLLVKLLMGMIMLFAAIIATMTAFYSASPLAYHPGLAWILILCATFSIVPIIFIPLTSQLLIVVVHSTWQAFFMFKSHNRLFNHVDLKKTT